jgi:hypothetical protein
VGQLTPLMSERYSPALTMIRALGEVPVCEGIIRDTVCNFSYCYRH